MVDSMSLMQKYTPFASINLQSLIMNHGSSNNSASNSCRLLWNCFLSQSPSLALKLRHRNDFWVYSHLKFHFFLLKYFVEILVKVKKWLQRTLKTVADKIKRQHIWRMVTKRRKKIMSLDQADRVKAFKISRFSFVNGRKINHRNKSQLLTACTNTCSMDT